MKPDDFFYAVASGPESRRRLLTPVGAGVFIGLLLLVVFASLRTDRALSLPAVLPGPAGAVVGTALLAAGVALWAWCIVLFHTKGRGTPVPLNPPRELVVIGPYAWVRNPMLTGVFASLFGLGCYLHSLSMVAIWTPAFILFNAGDLKWREEPELERRFGQSYNEYKHRVPMFIPRRTRYAGGRPGVAP